MSVQWTKEQQKVIDLRNRNMLVSAAAGSGKTAVLVERILSMITDPNKPADIDRLLIVTFTNAAAAEMRERIGAAISKRLEENPENVHLQRQSTLIHVAKITTIHSFCLYVIHNYSSQLDIDPSFRIGDEGELKLLREEVVNEILDQHYEEGSESFGNFIESYASGKSDYGISDLILKLYDFSQSYPWPGDWLEQCSENFEHSSLEELKGTSWMQYLLEDVRIQARELSELNRIGLEMCLEPDGPYMYEKMFLSDQAVLTQLKAAEDYEEICRVLRFLSFERMSGKKDEAVDPEKREQAKALRERIKKSLQDMKKFYHSEDPASILSDLEGSREGAFVLIRLTLEFAKRFTEKKREKNILDFNDFEHLALQVLVHREGDHSVLTPAAEELSSQFEEILIDEYQDSNLVQETILTSISRERLGQPNIFMVGDVKQSIYRFRLARPELFMEKYDTYTAEDSSYQKIELHKNFRSRSTVLESINFIFYQIMQKSMGNIEYNEAAALHPGIEFPPAEDILAGTPTELLLTDLQEEIEKGRSRLAEDQIEYTSKELEAKMIAERIREMTDPETGLSVFDKEKKEYRIARYQDIVILLRSVTGGAEVFINVLSNEGIPAFAQSQTGYFTAVEVQTVLSMLKVIDNPMDDIPLAAVLHSPIGSLSSTEIALMMSAFKQSPSKRGLRGIYGAWQYYMEYEEGNADLKDKLCRLWRLLQSFRHRKTYLNLHDLLHQVLEETGYYSYVSAMPMGETRKGNLDMLVSKAVSYEQTSYHGLFHFVKYIEKLQKFDMDYGEASLEGENDNTVRIMSIHKSKGLEFPIVFLAGLNKQFNRLDTYSRVLLHPDMGIAADYVDLTERTKAPTLMKKVFRRRLEIEDMGEELRVLYVALTRAKEKLIMTGTGKKLSEKSEKYAGMSEKGSLSLPFTLLSSANSYLDWIMMALGREEGFPFQNEMFHVRIYSLNELMSMEVEKQAEDEIARGRLLAMDLSEPFDGEVFHELQERLCFRYPHMAAVHLHSKMSVSELKHQGQMIDEELSEPLVMNHTFEKLGEEERQEPLIPKFLQEGKPLKGASRGSAYHRVMELIDFKRLGEREGAAREIERLYQEGKIQRAVYDAVYISKIQEFCRTDLGRRMISAAGHGRLYKEKQFVIGREEEDTGEVVLIQGIIDAYFKEGGDIVLVDYKTDRVKEGGEEELTGRYGVQLSYYKEALEQITGKKVKEVYLYSFALGKEILIG